MKLTVNGEPREIPEGARIPELLTILKVETGQVAVEVNGTVVRRARHGEVALKAGDQVEVVSFVGGG